MAFLIASSTFLLSSGQQIITTSGRANCITRTNIWCLSSTNNDENQRSVGDVVKGLHGGKYQFDEPSSNFVAQQFIENSYGGGDEVEMERYDKNNEPLPSWFEKLKPPIDSTLNNGKIVWSSDNIDKIEQIVLKNQEMTWERYYVKLMDDGGSHIDESDSPFKVEPKTGQLAPRGGSSGISDSATISIQITTVVDGSKYSRGDWWLVCGTEEENWCYLLSLT